MYIGHTAATLLCRLNGHISMSKRSNNKFYTMIKHNGDWEYFDCSIVEEYPCKDKYEARQREEFWRKSLNAVMNSNRAFVSVEEKIIIMRQRNREWYIKNRDYILDKRRNEYITDPKKINERVTIYRNKNREVLNKKALAKYHLRRMNQNKNDNEL